MATTSYVLEILSPVGQNGKPDPYAPKTTFEVIVSSFSGEPLIYLRLADPRGGERAFALGKDQAITLHDGLTRAAAYLRYID
ncbi:MAG: hypothetical protein HYY78_12210 [Betaproteobacteria bacterium]|nr:hypothetical protein [Betaproteobacteria bacterium]